MAHRTTAVSALVVFACCLASAFATSGPIVTTADGKVQGKVSGSVNEFLGIPFAAPPVGDNRWRAPQPTSSWSGVKQTVAWADNCAQPGSMYNPTSEDCLYLNVYSPTAPSTSGPLPVMLWFYGGTWIHGGAGFALYDGMFDVALEKDVIIVTANYRLGAFGFLGSQALANRTTDGSYGNYGLLDQREAMRWVQKNIGAFGGDSQRVTIYGESAGAGSVSCHLVMEGSAKLFQGAMMESGPMASWVGESSAHAEYRYTQALTMSGCSTVDCLVGLSTEQLIEISQNVKVEKVPGHLSSTQWGPVIDGVELVGKPSQLAAAGKVANVVPTLLGSNHDEGTMFAPLPRNTTTAAVEFVVAFMFGETMATEILAAYPAADFQTPWFRLARIVGDAGFTCAVRRTSRWLTAAGAPVFPYFFTHRPYWMDEQRPWMGVSHTAELPFVWDFVPLLHGATETSIAEGMVLYWTNMAAFGNPNGKGGNPMWSQYDASSDVVMNLNATFTPLPHLKETVCNLWDKVAGFASQ